MRIRTSSRLSGYMPGIVTDHPPYSMFQSLAGLGQNSIDEIPPPTIIGIDPSIFGSPTFEPITIPDLPVSSTQATDIQSLADVLNSITPAVPSNIYIPGAGGGYVNAQTGQVVSAPPSGSQVQELAQIINAATAAAQNALKIYQQASGPGQPYLVPGTQLVYNPATGQLGSALGITGQQIAPAALASILPVGLVVIGLFLVMSMMGGRR